MEELYGLIEKFQKLGDITGRNKTSSYGVHLNFYADGEILLELGTYDVGDWNRHTYITVTKETLLTKLHNIIEEATKEVQRWEQEEE